VSIGTLHDLKKAEGTERPLDEGAFAGGRLGRMGRLSFAATVGGYICAVDGEVGG